MTDTPMFRDGPIRYVPFGEVPPVTDFNTSPGAANPHPGLLNEYALRFYMLSPTIKRDLTDLIFRANILDGEADTLLKAADMMKANNFSSLGMLHELRTRLTEVRGIHNKMARLLEPAETT